MNTSLNPFSFILTSAAAAPPFCFAQLGGALGLFTGRRRWTSHKVSSRILMIRRPWTEL
jgi:hypothetical protein